MWRSILQSRWTTVIALGLAVLLGMRLLNLRPGLISVEKEKSVLENQVAELRRAQDALEKDRSVASSDAYLERQARLKLNYKKPDEQVVFIYQDQYNSATSTAPVVPEVPRWKQWWQYLWGGK